MSQLLKACEFAQVYDGAVAGTTDTLSGSISDLADYDGIVYVASLGTVTSTAVVTLQAQGNTANSTSGMATYTGSSSFVATGLSNTLVCLDVYRPSKRYIRPQIVRATANVVVNNVVAIKYQGRVSPVTQPATVAQSTSLVSP